MKYLKHYWISKDGSWATATNPVEKRHPEAEYAGLGVKVWMHDPDGIDVCLSTVPDDTTIAPIVVGTKNAVQELTEDQFNSVWTPLQESSTARQEAMEAERDGDADTAATKNALADTKYTEATTALHAL
jgi:hypothetical protein